MLKVNFQEKESGYKILCLGAHCDDIEIGCAGTILKLVEYQEGIEFRWVVFSADEVRGEEAAKSAKVLLQNAGKREVTIKHFRDGFFPYIGLEIKGFFEQLKREFAPDLVFTHYRYDLHQDHRLICELTWNTFRDHLILEYETPKYDGDLGSPNLFVHLDEATCRRKTECILQCFKTQADNHWFSEETFRAIMRLRGIESNAPDGYAEAFYCRKLVL